MDKKTKMFFAFLILATLVSISFLYYRAFVSKDYDVIQDETPVEY